MIGAGNAGRGAEQPPARRSRAKPTGVRSKLPQLDNGMRVLLIAVATAVLAAGGILVAHADTFQAASAKRHGDLIGFIVVVAALILVLFSILCPGRFREPPVEDTRGPEQPAGDSPIFKKSVDELGRDLPADGSAAQPTEQIFDG